MSQELHADTLPLEGVRVVDLTLAMAGPLSTQRLAEMGADVVKVEAPGGGDFSRHWHMGGITSFGDALPFVTLNRSKRSIVLNLKDDEGRLALYKLVETADAVVMNYRPGVAARLGIDYDDLKRHNPTIVVVSITGYGETGPMAKRPGQDLLLQSFTGMAFNAGAVDGLPHPAPTYVADALASHHATEAVLAGLMHRALHGKGGAYRVSLMEALMEMQSQEITAALVLGGNVPRSRSPQASIWMEPPYGVYRTADGFLAIAQADLDALGAVLDLPELSQWKAARPDQSDTQALNAWRDRIYFAVQRVLETNGTTHWDHHLSEAGIWTGIAQDYDAFLAHEQTQNALIEVEHPRHGRYRTVVPGIRPVGGPPPKVLPAPGYGADTKAVLSELGYGDDDIAALSARGTIVAAADAEADTRTSKTPA